jgi:hypothetical protein
MSATYNAHLILIAFIILIIFEEHKVCSPSLCSILQPDIIQINPVGAQSSHQRHVLKHSKLNSYIWAVDTPRPHDPPPPFDILWISYFWFGSMKC